MSPTPKSSFKEGENFKQVAAASLPSNVSKEILNPANAIYDRMIIIVPYKAPEAVKKIQSNFERINMQCLNLENSRYLSTKVLSPIECSSRLLDYIGGFELIDAEMRIFVFEGLAGVGNSMHQFYEANQR